MEFTDSLRDDRKINLEVFYPANADGKDVPFLSPEGERPPFICFGHGFLMPVKAYANLWETLVPRNYIVVFVKKERGLAPSHLDLARDMRFVAEHFPLLANDTSSLFFNRIGEECCLMGHSMGGGAALLAGSEKPSARAVCTFAVYDTHPSAIGAARQITAPALVFAGKKDCITPPQKHQLPVYRALKSPSKTIITIRGAGHCLIARDNKICLLAGKFCFSGPLIPFQEQHAIINEFLVPWLDYTLKNRKASGRMFDSLLVSDDRILFDRSASLVPSSR